MELKKRFTFEAAHRLPNVPDGHKCGNIHGHSFTVEVGVSGEVQRREGWVMDFAEVGAAMQPILDELDHSYLNEVEGLSNPTSENIAIWIWQRLEPSLPGLASIAVYETPDSGCIYRGPGQ